MHWPTLPCREAKHKCLGVGRGVELRLHAIENRRILGQMSAVPLEDEAVRKALANVLNSPGFARNERLSRFLRFIVKRHLEGRDLELK